MKRTLASLLLATFTLAPLGAVAAPSKAVAPAPLPAVPLPAVPKVASGYTAPEAAPSAPAVVGVTAQPFVGITLQDAVGMALLKNPDLAVASANARIASYQIEAAKGAFDVNFVLEPSITHMKSAPQNAFFAGPSFGPIEQNRQQVAGGVAGILPGGAQYSVNVSSTKVDDNTIINSFNPYFPTTLSATLTQPLLRGAGTNPAKHQLAVALVGADSAQAQALGGVSQTLAQVSDAYWNLVAAWRNVAIQEDALKQAVAQQGSTQRLAKHGAAANIDAVESSSQVATFEDNLYSALQNVSELQNALKTLVVNDPSDPIWRANLVPTSSVQQLPPAPTLDALIATALEQRPEVRQVADARKLADANLHFAKNEEKPKVDLQLGYTSNGFAGQPTTGSTPFGPSSPPPAYLVGNTSKSVTNLLDNKFPTYSAAVVLSTPLGNHTAKAQLAAAQEQERIADIQSAGLQQRITAEARNALQGYQSALARLRAARVARRTAEEVNASEERKFRNGVSTTFLVLQRQVELAQARGRELQAQTDLNKAVVELQRVSGNILRDNNVTLSTVGQGATK